MFTITQRVVRRARRNGVVVLNRRQWGSKHKAQYQWRRFNRPHNLLPKRPADTGWLHITVTFDDGVLVGDFKKDMQEVERIGQERFGSGFSYNWGVDCKTGMVGLGQALDAAGTHTINEKGVPGYSFNQNYVSLAFAFIGMPGDKPSWRAVNALGTLIACHIVERALTMGFDFNPHRFVAWKSCPTQPMVNVMDEVHKIAMARAKAMLAAKRKN